MVTLNFSGRLALQGAIFTLLTAAASCAGVNQEEAFQLVFGPTKPTLEQLGRLRTAKLENPVLQSTLLAHALARQSDTSAILESKQIADQIISHYPESWEANYLRCLLPYMLEKQGRVMDAAAAAREALANVDFEKLASHDHPAMKYLRKTANVHDQYLRDALHQRLFYHFLNLPTPDLAAAKYHAEQVSLGGARKELSEELQRREEIRRLRKDAEDGISEPPPAQQPRNSGYPSTREDSRYLDNAGEPTVKKQCFARYPEGDPPTRFVILAWAIIAGFIGGIFGAWLLVAAISRRSMRSG